jgi:hypothetical protein
MDEAQVEARLVGRSAIARLATRDDAGANLALRSPTLDAVEQGFEDDVRRWLVDLYAIRAERLGMRSLKRLWGAGWLGITVATLAVPMLGIVAALAAVLLLLVMLGVAWRATAWFERERADRDNRLSGRAATPSTSLPAIGPEERAQLVRLMNLSRTAWRPTTRMLLRAEWREARSSGPLADWGPMYDLEDVVLANPFAHPTYSE